MDFFGSLNWRSIRTKLILFLLLPIFTILFFAATGIHEKRRELQNTEQFESFMFISHDLADLVYELQKERGLSAGFVGSNGLRFADEMREQRKQTDEKHRLFTVNLSKYDLADMYWGLPEEFTDILKKLQKLSAIRHVLDIPEYAGDFFDYYSDVNALMLHLIQYLEVQTSDAFLARQADAFTTLLWLQERAGQERGSLNGIFAAGQLDIKQFRNTSDYITNQENLLRNYYTIASEQKQTLLRERMSHPVVAEVRDIRISTINNVMKNGLLDRLQALAGYGGPIHEFQNDVISGKQLDMGRFEEMLAEAKTIIREYREYLGQSTVEIAHINNIEATIEKYHSFLRNLLKMKQDRRSISEIDKLVKINGEPAIDAIKYLRKEATSLDTSSWWSKATLRIDLIEEVSDIVWIDIVNRSTKIKDNAAYSLYISFLITAITLVVVFILGHRLTKRLVVDVISIATNIRSMQATGNFDRLLDVSGNDEISEIANAFNNLITNRNNTEDSLRKLSHAVESSSSSVLVTGKNGNIEYINNKFEEVTGYSKQDVIGKNPSFLKSGETSEEVYIELWETITAGKEWHGELHNKRKDGRLYWDRVSISGVRNAEGEITHYIGMQEDVTHEYELTEQLNYQASHDLLTGLINRSEFERRLERLIKNIKHDKVEHALCFMDLDQFKVVNDTCGHTAGDELLRQLGQVLQEVVRKRDTLARLGGDEFGVLMEHCTLKQAHRVAVALHKAVADFQFFWEDRSFRIGISIGLVPITEDVLNQTELLKQADAACYMAKDLGRNRIHVFHKEDTDLARRHGEMQWVTRIHQALEENSFCLYAQPIVAMENTTTGRHNYELLLRMKETNGNVILPGAFLPAAERYNIITKVDRWVIDTAFSTLMSESSFLRQIDYFSVNLSGQSLADKDFLDYVMSQLDNVGSSVEKICFEITETAAISNLKLASRFIHKVKERGPRFALDDFGSGLSSFSYLKNLPVDYLKIDGMFVKDIVDDRIDYAMVKSINEIGHVMGMQTIAECVENDDIKEKLKEIGVDYVQGYGIGKPMALDILLERSGNVTNSEVQRSRRSNIG